MLNSFYLLFLVKNILLIQMEIEDVSDIEMELDNDEEIIKDNVEIINDDEDDKSEENTNVEFEEEVIIINLYLKINI